MKRLTISIFIVIICFISVSAQTPVINSFTPSSGPVGSTVEIRGYYFKISEVNPALSKVPTEVARPPADYTAVKFGDYSAIVLSSTDTYIQVRVPQIPLGAYNIMVVNTNGGTTTSSNFTVTAPPSSPVSNIAFIHGWGENTSSTAWQYAKSIFDQEFRATNSTNNSYSGLNAINYTATNSASTLVPYSNSVVVAHSMGGLVAREIKRIQGSSSKVKALITVGTPHQGAPIGINATSNLDDLTTLWIYDLANGWATLFGLQYAVAVGSYYLGEFIGIFNDYFDPVNLNAPSTFDMRPGSNFLNTLNSNPGASMPAATYAVYTREDWYSHWRLADTFVNGTETGRGVDFVQELISYYSYCAWIAYDEADYSYYQFLSTGDPWYMDDYFYWNHVARSFISGAYALNIHHQNDWNQWMVGEPLTAQNIYDKNAINDAFIPTSSQAPSFISSSKRLFALHTNHNEQTTSDNSLAQVRFALRSFDINLPVR